MNRTNKALVFGLIAVGTGLAVKKLWSLATISDRVSFVVSSFRVHKITVPKNITDLARYSVQLAVGLKIYNPTNNTVNLQLPSVKVLYKGKEIAISAPSSTITTVAPNSANERLITFDVPLHALTNIGLATDLLYNSDKLSEVLAQNVTIAIVATVNGVTISTVQALSGTDLALSAGPRTVLDGSDFNKYFPSVNDQRKRVVRNGEVDDVVNTAIAIVDKHHREAELIAQVLKGRTVTETASNIFDFAYSYLQYRRDKPGVEELRTPARSWHDGQIRHKQMGIESSGIDCDDYSIFCGSILKCLNIPFRFRITKYDGRSYFQHIYVYIPATSNNPEIIIDPVLDKFDYEKPYSEQKDDFNMAALYAVEGLAGMPIETLSGIDDAENIESIVTGGAILQGLAGIEGDTVSAKSVMDSTLDYLIQSRDTIARNPQSMAAFTNDVTSLLAMFDNAINAWNTPDRDRVLEYITQYEEALEKSGVFKPIQGLNGEQLGGFFKKIGKLAKNVAKTALAVAKPLVATAATALAASNPVTAAFAPFAAKVTNKIIPNAKKTTKKKTAPAPAATATQQTTAAQALAQTKSAVVNSLPVNTNPVDRVIQNASLVYNSNQAAQKSAQTTVVPTQAPIVAKPAPSMAPSMAPAVYADKGLPLTPSEQLTQSYLPTQQATVEQQIQPSMSTENTSQPGFFARNKKPLLIAGGALLLGTAAVLIFRKKKNAPTPIAPSRQGGALAGLPASRKRKPAKSKTKGHAKNAASKTTAKSKAAAKSKAPAKRKSVAPKKNTRRGVKRVTLR